MIALVESKQAAKSATRLSSLPESDDEFEEESDDEEDDGYDGESDNSSDGNENDVNTGGQGTGRRGRDKIKDVNVMIRNEGFSSSHIKDLESKIIAASTSNKHLFLVTSLKDASIVICASISEAENISCWTCPEVGIVSGQWLDNLAADDMDRDHILQYSFFDGNVVRSQLVCLS